MYPLSRDEILYVLDFLGEEDLLSLDEFPRINAEKFTSWLNQHIEEGFIDHLRGMLEESLRYAVEPLGDLNHPIKIPLLDKLPYVIELKPGDVRRHLLLKLFYRGVSDLAYRRSLSVPLRACGLEQLVDTLVHLNVSLYLSKRPLGAIVTYEQPLYPVVTCRRFEDMWDFIHRIFGVRSTGEYVSELVVKELQEILPSLSKLRKRIEEAKKDWENIEGGVSPRYLKITLDERELLDTLRNRKTTNGTLDPFISFCDKVWFNEEFQKFSLHAQDGKDWKEEKGVILVDKRFKDRDGLPILFEYLSYLSIKDACIRMAPKILGTHNIQIRTKENECEVDLLLINAEKERVLIGECTLSENEGSKEKQLGNANSILTGLGLTPISVIITPKVLDEFLNPSSAAQEVIKSALRTLCASC